LVLPKSVTLEPGALDGVSKAAIRWRAKSWAVRLGKPAAGLKSWAWPTS
jgi:hypothetical protein